MKKNCKFAAVILAAGMSTRLGRPKQLLRVAGKSMLEHAITAARGAGIVTPVLVLGAFADDNLKDVRSVTKCETIFNHNFADGQATSLKAGVSSIMDTCDAAIFMLADQPLITATLIMELMTRFNQHKPHILHPVYRERRGNPVIISARLFPRLLASTGDQGARFLFADTSLRVHAYEVEDKAVVTDVDTWDDYFTLVDSANGSTHPQKENR